MAQPKISKAKLEELDPDALIRLREIIRKGSDKDALAAIEVLFKRTRPEPKVNTAEVGRQAALAAGAGASAGLIALASKAQARIAPPRDITDVSDYSLHTLTEGVKSE